MYKRSKLDGFGDGSVLPEDLRPEEEEEEERELILDGGLPRYTSSSLTSDLLLEDGREMAVDEEVKEVEELKRPEKAEESVGSLPRKPPPSWEEWKLSSLGRARGAEECRSREKQEELRGRGHEEEQEEEQEEEEEEVQRSEHESIVSLGNLIL
ncbi:cilia- and flagella-associated protein 251-like, partial [Plectropomus leopardus]|uniref:cilia- and flagella-associated protein 251-like n=1 Tax=Plectropomus leopardus TaxID=160734 RepID=UPI001C4D94B7